MAADVNIWDNRRRPTMEHAQTRAKAQMVALDSNGTRLGAIEERQAVGLAQKGLAQIHAKEGTVSVFCSKTIEMLKARASATIIHKALEAARTRAELDSNRRTNGDPYLDFKPERDRTNANAPARQRGSNTIER